MLGKVASQEVGTMADSVYLQSARDTFLGVVCPAVSSPWHRRSFCINFFYLNNLFISTACLRFPPLFPSEFLKIRIRLIMISSDALFCSCLKRRVKITIIFEILLVFICMLPSVHLSLLRLFMVSVFPPYIFRHLAFLF